MSEEEEDFAAICDGFVEMLVEKFPGLDYSEVTGGFKFRTKTLSYVEVVFHKSKIAIAGECAVLYFDYSDPECLDKAMKFCSSMDPLNIANGFTVEDK